MCRTIKRLTTGMLFEDGGAMRPSRPAKSCKAYRKLNCECLTAMILSGMSSDLSNHPIGILGLGIIGSRVAERCRVAGLNVFVWNRTPREVSNFVRSPGELAARAGILQIFVSDDAALAGVVAALLPALGAKHTVINSSTVSPDATHHAAGEVGKRGAVFLDCPFTGSKNAAAAGELTYYVGGPVERLEKIRWALEPSAKTILPVGDVGHATVLKIATNMISATTVEILCEAMAVVAAHGVPLEKFAAAMEHNACSSGLTRMKIPSILERDFEPHFSLKNMLKDARYAKALAEQGGFEVPALSAAAERMAGLVNERGEDDYSVLATHYLG
ncbi:MAG: NAD(P)-dependent oxidoreductase [Verrucomicrobiales bacterium]